MQTAWYRDGKSLSDPDTVAGIARELGLDGDAVAAAFRSQDARDKARREFRIASDELGVQQYPTLLLTVDGTTTRLGGPTTKPAELIRLYDGATAAAAS